MANLSTKLIPMTPYELYIRKVSSIYDGIRATQRDLEFLPADFGGIFGQRSILKDGAVLEIIEVSKAKL